MFFLFDSLWLQAFIYFYSEIDFRFYNFPNKIVKGILILLSKIDYGNLRIYRNKYIVDYLIEWFIIFKKLNSHKNHLL